MRWSFISDTQARTIATQLTCVFAALANGMFCSSTASAASWNEFHADESKNDRQSMGEVLKAIEKAENHEEQLTKPHEGESIRCNDDE